MLVLFGSPRPNGYTSQLTQSFLSAVPESVVVAQVNAYREAIAPCMGCGYCGKADGCISSDFDKIHQQLELADYLVIATPVYNLSFPAPLKAIFDRTQRYFSARFSRNIRPPLRKHKRAALLLTAGSGNKEAADIIRRQLTMMFTVMNTSLEEEFICVDTDAAGIREEQLAAAACIARRLTDSRQGGL